MKQREMMNKQELTLEALETVCGGTIGPVLPDWSWLIEDEKKEESGATGGWRLQTNQHTALRL